MFHDTYLLIFSSGQGGGIHHMYLSILYLLTRFYLLLERYCPMVF